MTKVASPENEIRAKLFENGRSQAVRLPKEFRFEGKEVRVRRALDGVLLEAVESDDTSHIPIEEWFAQMDALRDGDLFPEREEQPLAEERDPIL
jgi:antitoxin VapB